MRRGGAEIRKMMGKRNIGPESSMRRCMIPRDSGISVWRGAYVAMAALGYGIYRTRREKCLITVMWAPPLLFRVSHLERISYYRPDTSVLFLGRAQMLYNAP